MRQREFRYDLIATNAHQIHRRRRRKVREELRGLVRWFRWPELRRSAY